ncbi:hypothetical protein HDV00_007610 [Rhizophlyctis rosea]|nr:hypothetical protein HDV00_007610 [Rhizophlyctis rosea]
MLCAYAEGKYPLPACQCNFDESKDHWIAKIVFAGKLLTAVKSANKTAAENKAWLKAGQNFEKDRRQFADAWKKKVAREALAREAKRKESLPAQPIAAMDAGPGVRLVTPQMSKYIARSDASPFVATGGAHGWAGAKEEALVETPKPMGDPIPLKLEKPTVLILDKLLAKLEASKPFPKSADLMPPPKMEVKRPTNAEVTERSDGLHEKFQNVFAPSRWDAVQQRRTGLGVVKSFHKIRDQLAESNVLIVGGPSGCGKTTTLPCLIFEDAVNNEKGGRCSMLVISPRAIYANTCAKYVAQLWKEDIGEDTVRIWERAEDTLPRIGGHITYAAAATVLQALLRADSVATLFGGLSHIIVDETQEHDLSSQFIIAVVKRLLKRQTDLKLIILTTASAKFVEGFKRRIEQNGDGEEQKNEKAKMITCRSVMVEGHHNEVSTHYAPDIIEHLSDYYADDMPIQLMSDESKAFVQREAPELSDGSPAQPNGIHLSVKNDDIPYDLMCLTITFIVTECSEGSILVILPDVSSISRLQNRLLNHPPLRVDPSLFQLKTLYSSMESVPDDIFASSDNNVRKIILATAFAESSVTIPDVGYVLDSGKASVAEWNSIIETSVIQRWWASKTEVEQRVYQAGHAGEGQYFGFFSEDRRDGFPPQTPYDETDPVEILLRKKALYPNQYIMDSIADFFETPVDETRLREAIGRLQALQAFSPDGQIKPLGRLMARFCCAPEIAKLLIYGMIFRCLDPILTIAAVMTCGRSLFDLTKTPAEIRHARELYARGKLSDHAVWIRVFIDWRSIHETAISEEDLAAICTQKQLDDDALHEVGVMRMHLAQMLRDVGCLPAKCQLPEEGWESINDYLDLTDTAPLNTIENIDFICSLPLVALWPNFAVQTQTQLLTSDDVSPATFHPIHSVLGKTAVPPQSLCIYQQKIKESPSLRPHLTGCTRVTPLAAVIFGCAQSTTFRRCETSQNEFGRRMEFTFDEKVTVASTEFVSHKDKGDLSKAVALRGKVWEMVEAWVTRVEGYGRRDLQQAVKEVVWEETVVREVAGMLREAEKMFGTA